MQKINAKIVVRGILEFNDKNDSNRNRNNLLTRRLNKVTFIDGYSHDELEGLLSDVHLGIIPVIWEDNLPQIAIEMVSFGVPILASSAGGASEISQSEYFKFKVGSIEDFIKKLTFLMDNEDIFDDFWLNKDKLTSMESHINFLKLIYKNESK